MAVVRALGQSTMGVRDRLDQDIIGQRLSFLLDLLQMNAQVRGRQDPVQSWWLVERVAAIAGEPICVPRSQQPQLIVVPQHPGGDLPQPGDLADRGHGLSVPRLG